MAITLVTDGAVIAGQNNGGDVTLSLPAGIQEGDVVVAFGGHAEAGATAEAGPVTAGYTDLFTTEQTTNGGYWAGYKVMGATPDSQFVGNGDGDVSNAVVYGCYVLRGVDTSTVPDASAVKTGETVADASNIDCDPITTVTDGAWVIAVAYHANSAKNFFGYPTGYSNGQEFRQAETNRYAVASATKEVTTAGAEDPGPFNWAPTNGQWNAATIAIRPDTGGGGAALVKVQGETVQIADAELRLLSLVRMQGETVQIAEATLPVRALVRLASETVQVAESTLRLLGITRVASEVVQVAESVFNFRGLIRVASETVQVAESSLTFRGLVRIADETVQVAEAVARAMGLVRMRNAAVQVSEATIRALGLTRVTSEAVQLSEGAVRVRGLRRVVSEAMQVAESSAFVRGLVRVASDTVQVGETAVESVAAAVVKVVSETVQVAEGTARLLGLVKIIDETIQVAEATLRRLGLVRIVSEVIQVAESIARARALVRIQDETERISEGTLRARVMARIRDETVNVVEATLRARALVRVADEAINITEAAVEVIAEFLGIVMRGTVSIVPKIAATVVSTVAKLSGDVDIDPGD